MYYWLRLKRDFFKRHDVQIIESMQNGKDYVLFYLKLLVEAIDHEGALRFSDTIPYSAEMLSTITNTNVDIVKSALKLFKELDLIDLLDDQTIFMTEINEMIGSCKQDDEVKENTRLRVKAFRERQKMLSNNSVMLQERYSNVTCNVDIDIDKDKDIDIDKDINKENKKKETAFIKESFNSFWSLYPKKVGKANAEKAWNKIKPNEELLKNILNSVKENIQNNQQWNKDNGQFIPYPATWLNREQWNDEVTTIKTTNSSFKGFKNEFDRDGECEIG